jgi:hypothetical protein
MLLFAGAVLCGKIVRSHASNWHLCLEAALLGAKLVAAVFACSLNHPQRLIDFASYAPLIICEDRDLFLDQFALNVTDMIAGVDTIVANLIDCGCALECLPCIAIWEWAAQHVTRSSRQVVRCRLMRVRALCALGCLADAHAVTTSLMVGARLPDAHCPRDVPIANSRKARPRLKSSQSAGADESADAVQLISKGGMPQEVAELYGAWACAQVVMARAAILQALGRYPYPWKETHPLEGRLLDSKDTVPTQVLSISQHVSPSPPPPPPPPSQSRRVMERVQNVVPLHCSRLNVKASTSARGAIQY